MNDVKKLASMSTDIDVEAANALKKLKFPQRIYESCVTDKLHKIQNRIAYIRATEKDELIHTDFVDDDLISIFTEKAKYVIVMTNDYIDFITIYLLKHKFNMKEVLRNYFKLMRTQKTFVRRLRFDNKKEYADIETQKIINEYKVI